MVREGSAAVLLLAVCACSAPTIYACVSDEECRDGSRIGQCQNPPGFCSFPDPGCPATGQRYGEHAGGRSGMCVSDGAAASASQGASTEVTAEAVTGSPPSMSLGAGDASATTGDDARPTSGPSSLDTGTEPGESTSSPSDPAYGPCGRQCETGCFVHGSGIFAACTVPCDDDTDCPEMTGPDGALHPTRCTSEFGRPERWCVVPCERVVDCPGGTEECAGLAGQDYGGCVWFL